MIKKFDLLCEQVMKTIEDSYVDYELFDAWKVRIEQKMRNMSKEQAQQYVRKSIGAYWNQKFKQEQLLNIYARIFGQRLILQQYSMQDDPVFQEMKNIYTADDRQDVKQIKSLTEKTFQNALDNFKLKFPGEFDTITLQYDFYKEDESSDIYAEVDRIKKNNILINYYPIFRMILQDRKSIDDILDFLQYDNPIIGHQLAHILDIRKRGWPTEQTKHDQQFQKYFKYLTGKDFVDYSI